MSLKHYIERISNVITNRGYWGLAVFLGERLLRCDKDLLFELKFDDKFNETQLKSIDCMLETINRININEFEGQSFFQEALSKESQVYKQGLHDNDILFLVHDKDSLVHTTFAQFKSKYKNILGEADTVPLLGNCWTSEKYRGKGIYPYILAYSCNYLRNEGFSRVIITCDPTNIASIRGIEKAGFSLVKKITSTILLNTFVFQVISKNNGKTIRFARL